MAPVQPRPITTTSFAGSLCAIRLLQFAHSSDVSAQRASLRPVRMAGDADRRQCHALVVTLDPLAIIVVRAGKADHLPADHVLVAAIDRIGEESVLGVLEQRLEEVVAIRALELERLVFQSLDDLVLVVVGELGKRLAAELLAASPVERGERLSIVLRGSRRGLVALLLGALLERSAHVAP